MIEERFALTLCTKGRITLPAEIRKHLDLKQGDLVEFEWVNGAVHLRPQRAKHVRPQKDAQK